MNGDTLYPAASTEARGWRWIWVAFVAAAVAAAAVGQRSGFAIPATAEPTPVLLPPEDISDTIKRDLIDLTSGARAQEKVEGAEAAQINASLPFSRAPIEKAAPVSILAASAADQALAERCLTEAVYHEAAFESLEGRRAVAQVVLNRLRHPAFPKNVCGVVYQGSNAPGCQFSFTCDGSLNRTRAPVAWVQAASVAREALSGRVAASVGQATHYHASYVAPYWAPKLAKIAQIGTHIFYRWPGAWGRKRAFTGRYTGGEAAGDSGVAAGTTGAPGQAAPLGPTVERRAPNDVGGRLDVTKGWTLSIPDPRISGGALAQAMSAQLERRTDLAAVSSTDKPRAE